MSAIRFDGKTAIVTGAGHGLGRAHAMLLASRGANVVVNDLGCSVDGTGASVSAAQQVADEIKAAGGQAIANSDSVTDRKKVKNIVDTAINEFGGLHILVNNAGILRDRSFKNITDEDWDSVIDTHLNGTYNVTKAAWPHLREQAYGRIVVTASGSGMFGNFGQTNYGAAKAGLIGFAKALGHEGAKYNIRVNILCPAAASRMTQDLMPSAILDKLKPESVSPIVGFLCSDEVDVTGGVFEAGAGAFAHSNWARSHGYKTSNADNIATLEEIRDHWKEITDLSSPDVLDNPAAAMGKFMQ
ncbi:MAG TPA: hypothetical protein DCZ03_15690 [Gammaproteobacteria bacterium]|nr:hypothetical protein [Gammaproteobacteria bacterium]